MAAVRFFGALNNHSGYGNAVRNFAKAFSISNINTNFSFSERDKEANKDFIATLNQYTGKCNVDFYLHGPPYTRHKSANYKIAYFYWELDRLPRQWLSSINQVQEIWAPCQLIKNACLKANFKGRIKVVPTPCEVWTSNNKISIPIDETNKIYVSDNVFLFYSIFQWHVRKGYEELLSAYYKTFTKGENVLLILKVNSLNIKGYDKGKIKPTIEEIKRKLNQKYYPPIYLITDLVSEEVIRSIHTTGQCLISASRGEGWNMVAHDAMICGKQLIITKYGGISEYLDETSAHIIKHTLGSANGMEWNPLYGEYQNWAYPSINHLGQLMRDVYENYEDYAYKGKKAREIALTMSIENISNTIKENLNGF